jgi:hypothetical protein
MGLLFVAAVSAFALATPTSVLAASISSSSSTITSSSASDFTVFTDKPNYTGNAIITVYGVAPVKGSEISISIADPRGAVLGTSPLAMPSDGNYRANFTAGGLLWNKTGTYHVTVIIPQPDNVAAPPTATTTFSYTAVAVTSTSTSASVTTSVSNDSSGLVSAIVLFAVVIALVALVGIMLRARGRGRRRVAGANSTKAPPSVS